MMIPCIPGSPHHFGHRDLLDSLGPQPMNSAAFESAYWASSTVLRIVRPIRIWKTVQESSICPKQSKPATPTYKCWLWNTLLSLKSQCLPFEVLKIFQLLWWAHATERFWRYSSIMRLHSLSTQWFAEHHITDRSIFKMNVTWFQCPFFHSYFLSTIFKIPHFLQGLLSGPLLTHPFTPYHHS